MWTHAFILFGRQLGAQLLGHMIAVCLIFQETCQTIFHTSSIILHYNQKYMSFSFATPLPKTETASLSDVIHFSRYAVVLIFFSLMTHYFSYVAFFF